MYDFTVVGTGPAGAVTAFLLARSGFRTVMVDKRDLPRAKVCGGLVTTHCANELREILGEDIPTDVHVDPPSLTIRAIPPSGREAGFHILDYPIHNIDRSRFDHWLTSRAVEEGATLLTSHELVQIRDEGVSVLTRFRGPKGSVSWNSRYVVGADGVYSACRRGLLQEPMQATMSVVQEYHPAGDVFDNSFYLFFRGEFSPSYAYVEPKGRSTILGLIVHKDYGPSATRGMARFKGYLRREYGYEAGEPSQCEGWSIPFGHVAYGRERVILVGDAGGFTDPLTAEGIFGGVQSAKVAAQAATALDGDGTSLAEAFARIALPLGEKVREVAAQVRSLTDAERERRIRAKMAKLGRSFRIETHGGDQEYQLPGDGRQSLSAVPTITKG